jgi:uncharacterized protein YoxC
MGAMTKQTAYELNETIAILKDNISVMLEETEGEITEEIESMLEKLDKVSDDVRDKLDSYSHVVDSVTAKAESYSAVAEYYQKKADQAKKRAQAQLNIVSRLQDRAKMLFNRTFDTGEKVKTAKSTYYMQEYKSVDVSGVLDADKESLIEKGYGKMIPKLNITDIKQAIKDGVINSYEDIGAVEKITTKIRGL